MPTLRTPPSETRTVGAQQVAFRRRGAGPPLVLLHGAVCDSRAWRVEIETFSEAFTVVAWDSPGCGRSSDAPDDWGMTDFADCLAGLMDELGLPPAHVLGHSWGATLGLELALRHRIKVTSLTMVGGYAGWAGSLPADEVHRRLEFALTIAADLRRGSWDPTSMPGLFSDVMPPDRASELASIMAEIRPPGTVTMARALADADLREELERIAVPVLLVYGSADERASLEVARALHSGIPTSTLTVLPGLGHECHLEDAHAFASAVRGFLRQQTSPA